MWRLWNTSHYIIIIIITTYIPKWRTHFKQKRLSKKFQRTVAYIKNCIPDRNNTHTHVHTSSTVNKKVTIYYNVLLSRILIIIPHRYFYSTVLYFRAQARGIQQTETHCVIFFLINNTVISRSSVLFLHVWKAWQARWRWTIIII